MPYEIVFNDQPTQVFDDKFNSLQPIRDGPAKLIIDIAGYLMGKKAVVIFF